MAKKKTFISFDYDHDDDLRTMLVGQAKNEDTPFSISDWSVKEELSGDWKEKVKKRIKGVELVIVICGTNTNTATGVSYELKVAQDEEIPKPTSASASDKVYKWTWDNLKKLIAGQR